MEVTKQEKLTAQFFVEISSANSYNSLRKNIFSDTKTKKIACGALPTIQPQHKYFTDHDTIYQKSLFQSLQLLLNELKREDVTQTK